VATNREEQLLAHLSRQAATPEHLADELGVTVEEVVSLLSEIARKGWITTGAAWFGGDPASAVTIIFLTPTGREQAERREAAAAEPVVLSRAELSAELKRRFGYTDDQMDIWPALFASRFQFWPSVGAFAALPETD
jgi:DNA-binding MarR family transcriptional regulator